MSECVEGAAAAPAADTHAHKGDGKKNKKNVPSVAVVRVGGEGEFRGGGREGGKAMTEIAAAVVVVAAAAAAADASPAATIHTVSEQQQNSGGGGGFKKGSEAGGEKDEETSLSSEGECVVCMEAAKTHVFVPCGHMCVCAKCAATLMAHTRLCPACCTAATSAIQVFT